MNAIEIKGLHKTFPGFALEGIDLTLPQGCILGLVGENGAGKTTTIKLLLNMLRADSGSITVLGKDAADADKSEIGVVLDTAGFPQVLNARQIGKVMEGIFRNWDGALYEQYLARFALPERKPFKDYSRGMEMKLSIAVALSHGAKLLVLDEPTGGLDPVVRDEIVEIFSEFTRDESRAVLISSHIVSDLEKLCDYIAFLHKGKLVLFEEKDALQEQFGVLRCNREALSAIPADAIVGKRESAYGVEAILRRDAVPAGAELGRVSIEDLFVFMAKEER